MTTRGPPQPYEQIVCSGHSRAVQHISHSRLIDDTFWMVSSCLDGKAMLRNGDSGDWVGTFIGHDGAVWQSSFDPTATRLATASADFSVRIWDALNGDSLTSIEHPHVVKSVTWYDGGSSTSNGPIVTGTRSGHLSVIDPTTGEISLQFKSSHTGSHGIHCLAFGTSPNDIFSAAIDDPVLRRVDLRSPAAPVAEVTVPGLVQLGAVTAHGSGVQFLHLTTDVGVQLRPFGDLTRARFDVAVPDDRPAEKRTGPLGIVCSAAVLAGGNGRVAVGVGLKVKEFDLSGKLLRERLGHHGPVFSVDYGPRVNGRLVSTGEDGMLRMWPTAEPPSL